MLGLAVLAFSGSASAQSGNNQQTGNHDNHDEVVHQAIEHRRGIAGTSARTVPRRSPAQPPRRNGGSARYRGTSWQSRTGRRPSPTSIRNTGTAANQMKSPRRSSDS